MGDSKPIRKRRWRRGRGWGGVGHFNHLREKCATPQICQQAEGRGAVEMEWVAAYHTRDPLSDRRSPGDADPGWKADTSCMDGVFISSQL